MVHAILKRTLWVMMMLNILLASRCRCETLDELDCVNHASDTWVQVRDTTARIFSYPFGEGVGLVRCLTTNTGGGDPSSSSPSSSSYKPRGLNVQASGDCFDGIIKLTTECTLGAAWLQEGGWYGVARTEVVSCNAPTDVLEYIAYNRTAENSQTGSIQVSQSALVHTWPSTVGIEVDPDGCSIHFPPGNTIAIRATTTEDADAQEDINANSSSSISHHHRTGGLSVVNVVLVSVCLALMLY